MNADDTRPAVVHIITQLELGGAQRNTLHTVSHLDPERFRASLISGPGGVLDDEARSLRVPVTFCPSLGRRIDPRADARALLEIRAALGEHRKATRGPLVVHTHSSKAGILGRLAARAGHAGAIVHSVHGFGFHDGQSRWVRAGFELLEKSVAPLTDAFVFVSRHDLDVALRLGISTPAKARLIRSAIDLSAFHPDAEARARIRHELRIPPAAPVVVTVANFKPQKNPLAGLRAFALVARQRPEAHWIFAGDGELRGQFERAVHDAGLAANVHLVGWRTDVPKLLCAGDVYMLSSDHEGLPRSVLEALATGLPVAATAAGGTGEVVAEGTGILVEPGDVRALGEAVLRLMIERPDVGERAKSLLVEFDIDEMVRAQERLYEGLLALRIPLISR